MSKNPILFRKTAAPPENSVSPASLTLRPQAKVKTVALLLAVSSEKVRQLCHTGELEYTGRGRGFCVILDSVAAYQERELQKTKGRR